MAPTHYTDLMIREGSVAHDLHARMLLAAHHAITKGSSLAVAWPDWRDRPGEFGFLFRVLGNETALANYLDIVRPLDAAGLVRIYAPQCVPDGSDRVRFLRDRSHDKLSPSAVRRLTRRAVERGVVWSSTASQTRTAGDHFLTIPSTSQGQTFRLYVRRDRGDMDTSGANYGLGFSLPNF